MSYKLSFQSENALPSLAANQGQNAPMLFSISNPQSFTGSLFSCFAFLSVRGWRGGELTIHKNRQASERMEALCSSVPFETAQRYASCCTNAFGTKMKDKEVERFFFFLFIRSPVSYQAKTTLVLPWKTCCGLRENCPMNHKHFLLDVLVFVESIVHILALKYLKRAIDRTEETTKSCESISMHVIIFLLLSKCQGNLL